MAKKSKSKKSKTVVNNSEAENSTTLVEQTEKDLNPNMVETISDEDVATGGQELSADENVDLQSDSNEESIEHDSDAQDNLEASSQENPMDVSAEVSTEVSPENSTEDDHTIRDIDQIEKAIEALAFASPKIISTHILKKLLKQFSFDTNSLKDVLKSLENSYQERGIQFVKVGGGYAFRTHPKQAEIVKKLIEDKPARLSQSALEVLAIIAYKQPITRAEIDTVRGTDSGHLLRGLLEKNLVRTAGHQESAGRPLLYASSPYFLEVFSLGSLDDLPALEEFQKDLGQGEAEDEQLVLAADPSFYERESPLAAEPDRGDYDEPAEEVVIEPDFGPEKEIISEDSSQPAKNDDLSADSPLNSDHPSV